jgi:hypothetical protein
MGEPEKTSRVLGRALHSKRNRYARGFSFNGANWRRVAIFMEHRQPEKVLPLKVPVVVRCKLGNFFYFRKFVF